MTAAWNAIVGFNIPLDILVGLDHFGDDFMGQMTQPTVSQQ